MFFIYAQLIELQNLDLSSFLGVFSNFALVFYPVCDGDMANFKNYFDPHKAISFQMQLYCFSSNILRVAALTYRVVAPAFLAQISLFFIIKAAFYSRLLTSLLQKF